MVRRRPSGCPIEAGKLTINVKSERFLSLGWNDIDLTGKPVWFDPVKDKEIIEDLHWKEDLIWEQYSDFTNENILGKRIERIDIIGDDSHVTGIRFQTTLRTLVVKDNGDYILAYLK